MVKSTSRRIKSISKRPAGKAAPRKPAAPAKAPPKKPSAKAPAKSKWVFGFGNGKAEGRADLRNLLGGKGAGLAEMANLGLPVPPGFTITTAVCTHYYENGNAYPRTCRNRSAPRSPRSAASPARPSATATIRCWCLCARGRARPCRG